MALPAALVPLGRAAGQAFASAAPELKTKALEYVSRATNGRISSVDAASAFAVASKNGLATVATGLATNGLNPNRIFSDELLRSVRDNEVRQLAANLKSEFIRVYGPIDSASQFNDGQHEPNLSGSRQLAAETVSFVRRRLLGSSNDDKSVRALHVNLRLFVNMSEDMLSEALRLKASNA